MSGSRILLWVLLALALPVQGMTALTSRLGAGHAQSGVDSAAVMDCHDAQSSDAATLPPCCGEHCPDMTACVASAAMNSTNRSPPVIGRTGAPEDSYVLPEFNPRLTSPFRPPTVSRT